MDEKHPDFNDFGFMPVSLSLEELQARHEDEQDDFDFSSTRFARAALLDRVDSLLEYALKDPAIQGTMAYYKVQEARSCLAGTVSNSNAYSRVSIARLEAPSTIVKDSHVADYLKETFFVPPDHRVQESIHKRKFKKYGSTKRKKLRRRIALTQAPDDLDFVEEAEDIPDISVLISRPPIADYLENLPCWDFDVLQFDQICSGHSLQVLMHYLFDTHDLFSIVDVDRDTFGFAMNEIQKGYLDVPYHNHNHASDVLVAMHFFIYGGSKRASDDSLDIFCSFVAAAIHDFRHPGTNNMFSIRTYDDIALVYNDSSVLENYHLAEAFRLFKIPDCNIFKNMQPHVFKEARGRIIELVMATDMSKHLEICDLAELGANHDAEDESRKSSIFLRLMLHSADLASPIRCWDAALEWGKRVNEEFFRQGDIEIELGLQPSEMMTRNDDPGYIARTQSGFIELLVLPLYELLTTIFPHVKQVQDVARNNLVKWKQYEQSNQQN